MQKLHLVGFTTDHEGLILSARRGARSGGYVLTIDDAIEEAIDDLRSRRAGEDAEEGGVAEPPRPSRVESTLSVKEIQARLRHGRSIAEVAKVAGVDAEWVERFAPPILAERAQVIAKVRGVPLRRSRLGPSAQPIGEAVRHHLADRGVALTPDEYADAWTARQVAEGRWAVRCSFHYRGRTNVLQFDYDESTGSVIAADRASGQMGYVAPLAGSSSSKGPRRAGSPKPPGRPTVKRAVVSTGFRPDHPSAKAVSKSAKERQRAASAMRKGAAQRAVEAERAAARRIRERAAEAARKARADQATATRLERERRQEERAAAAAVKAREAAAKKAAAEKAKAAAVKAREAAAKKAVATKAAAAKAKAREVKAREAAANKAVATKAAAAKAKAREVASKKAAATKATAATQRATTAPRRPSASRGAPAPAAGQRVAKRTAVPTPPPVQRVATPVASSSTPPTVRVQAAPPFPARPASIGSVTSVTSGTGMREPARPMPRSVVAPAPARLPAPLVPAPSPAASTAAEPRALFREGLVEQADADRTTRERMARLQPVAERPAVAPPPSSSNGNEGNVARPVPDRPRRTRPLRAT